jgi:hypothetical protein
VHGLRRTFLSGSLRSARERRVLAGEATFTAQLRSANEQLSAQSEQLVGTSKQQNSPERFFSIAR